MLSRLHRGVLLTPQFTHCLLSFGFGFSADLLKEYGKEGETFGSGKYEAMEAEVLDAGETGEIEFGDGGVGG